jgi:hypothetical protein
MAKILNYPVKIKVKKEILTLMMRLGIELTPIKELA